MTDNTPTRMQTARDRVSSLTVAHVIVLIVLCSTVLMGVAIAQTGQQTFSDDFEDGDVDGWELQNEGSSPDISQESVEGSYSLYVETEMAQGEETSWVWQTGPALDIQDTFEISGTVRPNSIDTTSDEIRIGITGNDPTVEGENAFIIFNDNAGETYLASYSGEDADGSGYSTSFNNQWVNYRIESETGESEVRAKVWEYGTTEPNEWELTATFDGETSGKFSVNVGNINQPRELWLDSVEIDGREATDPDLKLDAPALIKHGESGRYSVDYTTPDNRTIDVTSEATVQSLNTDALTVDEENNSLIATEDSEFNDRVEVRAEYNGSATYSEVAVAEVSLENADILPTMFRFSALVNDGNFFFILLATLAGVVGTRWSTAFGGLSFFEIVIIIGWFGGWIQGGLMLVSVFFAGFIGLNLAANIDYTVRR